MTGNRNDSKLQFLSLCQSLITGVQSLPDATLTIDGQTLTKAQVLQPLTDYAVAPGISTEWLHLFVARGLTFTERAADGIEEREMTLERVPMTDAVTMCADGRIRDAKTIVGLLLASVP